MRMSDDSRQIVLLNNIGSRLKWVRQKLGLRQVDVARDVGLDYKKYSYREGGTRTHIVEEYLALTDYFNSKWEKSIEYKGHVISEITLEFILFGTQNDQARINKIISKIPH